MASLRTVRQRDQRLEVKLAPEQQKLFIDALAAPPAPNPRLREAYKRFRKYKAAAGS